MKATTFVNFIKKTALLIVLVFFTQANVFSQCLPNGISFNSQAQIDSFQTNYPGCTEILGDVNRRV